MSRDEKGHFLPGQAPRSPGRPKASHEYHLTQKMNWSEFQAIYFKMFRANEEALDAPKNNAERAVAAVLKNIIKYGDARQLELVFNRLFGKVPDKIQVSEAEELKQLPDRALFELAQESLEAFKKRIAAELAEGENHE